MNEYPEIYYHQQEPVCVAFMNESWDPSQNSYKSISVQQRLEAEYGLPFYDTSVGTGAAAAGFLIAIPAAVVSGTIWLFFQGKEIEPNIEAWKSLYDRYLSRFFKQAASFDRGGAIVLAVMELDEKLGREPRKLKLISYKKRSSRMELDEIKAGSEGEIDGWARIETATIHVFRIEADGKFFVVHVHGHTVNLKDET